MGPVMHKVVTEHPTRIPGMCTAPQVHTPTLTLSYVYVHEQASGVQAHTSCAHPGTYSGCMCVCPSGDIWGGSGTGGGVPWLWRPREGWRGRQGWRGRWQHGKCRRVREVNLNKSPH